VPPLERCLSTVPTHPGCCARTFCLPPNTPQRIRVLSSTLHLCTFDSTCDPLTPINWAFQKRLGHQARTPPIATNFLRSTRAPGAREPYRFSKTLIIQDADVLVWLIRLRCQSILQSLRYSKLGEICMVDTNHRICAILQRDRVQVLFS
jgi:hypothetical protein